MKMKAAGFVKKILSIIGKAKSMADLKNRMRNIKTRFMIYSLLSTDKKVLFGSISHKLQRLIQEQTPSTSNNQEETTLSLQQLTPVLYNDVRATILPLHITNIDARDDGDDNEVEDEEEEVVIDQNVLQVREAAEESNEFVVSAGVDEVHQENEEEEEEDDDTKMKEAYPDLRHSLFEAEDDYEMGRPGSVIELVKKTKEAQDGREFKLEDQIDEVADLYIQRFHRHMWMQKQNSFKRRSNT